MISLKITWNMLMIEFTLSFLKDPLYQKYLIELLTCTKSLQNAN